MLSPCYIYIYGQSGSLERQDVFCTKFDISVKKHFVGGRCWLRRPLLVPTTCSFFIQCIPHIVFTLFDPVRGLPSTCPKTGHELLSPTLPAVLKSNPPGKEDRKITSQGEIWHNTMKSQGDDRIFSFNLIFSFRIFIFIFLFFFFYRFPGQINHL